MKTLLSLLLFQLLAITSTKAQKDFYQLLVYHFQDSTQEQQLDAFLGTTFISQMHQAGFKNIGVFASLANDTSADKKIYILFPLKALAEAASWNKSVFSVKRMQEKSPAFWHAPHDTPVFTRMESILIEAWDRTPTMQLPRWSTPLEERIYELRSYESPSERYYRSKVHMFNEGGEIELFARLNFNAVFYGDVIAGSRMPNLMYMTCFKNMEDRNTHWKAFFDSPEWKKLISLKEYEHNVNKADILLMKAKSYSDF